MTHTFSVEIASLATLLEGVLDGLWDDLDRDVTFYCCVHQCGPCGVVKEFLDAGSLDYVLTFAPGAAQSAWWDSKEQRVDRAWLAKVWNCASQHEGDDDE